MKHENLGQIASVKRGSLRNDDGNNNATNQWFDCLNEEK